MEQKNGKSPAKKVTEETVMYCIGWCCIAALLAYAALKAWHPGSPQMLPVCIFWRLTGFYCPGCGDTRSFAALLSGRVWKAVVYHPFVPYSFGVGGWFMLSQTIERVSKGRIAIGMKYRDFYLWAALGIVLASCLIKNVLLVCGIDLLQ